MPGEMCLSEMGREGVGRWLKVGKRFVRTGVQHLYQRWYYNKEPSVSQGGAQCEWMCPTNCWDISLSRDGWANTRRRFTICVLAAKIYSNLLIHLLAAILHYVFCHMLQLDNHSFCQHIH